MSRGFLLDTNIPSEQIRQIPEPLVRQWLSAQPQATLFLSVVTIGGLRKGITLLPEGKRRLIFQRWLDRDLVVRFSDRILPVTRAVADRWGTLTAQRQTAGDPLGVADGLIAATALEHDLVLVTRNTKHFLGLDVPLLNPWEIQQPIA